MKNILFKAIAAASAVAVLCTGAFAAEIPYKVDPDFSNNRVTVSGTTDGDFVVFQVLDEGFDYNSVEALPSDGSMILFRDQVDANDGKFTFTMEYEALDREDDTPGYGDFLARLVTSGTEDTATWDLFLVTNTQYASVLETVCAAAKDNTKTLADFEGILKENEDVLGLDFTLSDTLSADTAIEMFRTYATGTLSASDMVKHTRTFNTYVLMEALKENKITNVDTYVDDTLLKGTAVYNDYKELVDKAEEQTYFTQKLTGKTYADVAAFEKAFKQALIFEEVRYATGSAGVKKVLTNYGSTVGITGAVSDSVCKQMSGQDYDAASILAAYNALKGSSGGNGGGGGGGGAAGGNTVTDAFNGTYITEDDKGTASAETVNAYFNDIDGVAWASEAILALADKGIINGKSEGYFKPNDFVTREEYAKILVGAMGYENEAYTGNIFDDVKETDWFCKYVNIAYSKNLLKGVGGGNFGSGQMISRQDMTVMLYNAMKAKGKVMPDGKVSFADEGKIADYAKAAVGSLYEMGIINGVSETEFDPIGNATRAQAAKIVYGALRQMQ